ncbi:MAG: hypothetical protein INH41_24875 [Myxococcaceae bacterium]|jgi:hypothetical protein|nr:hypothetical protein [Myxococcaceae bacterium]MCA3015635.1 hypothetical protein [Myxococcaceae bacterium]
MATHPPCGLYRTTRPLEQLPAGRLVMFHNHGTPGPGVYLPRAWALNRAEWHAQGITVPDAEWSASLAPLAAEGLYVVNETFHCCDQRCVQFPSGQLVQLGYDGEATPILFLPEWTARGLGFPERGTRLDPSRVQQLGRLLVAQAADAPRDAWLH